MVSFLGEKGERTGRLVAGREVAFHHGVGGGAGRRRPGARPGGWKRNALPSPGGELGKRRSQLAVWRSDANAVQLINKRELEND